MDRAAFNCPGEPLRLQIGGLNWLVQAEAWNEALAARLRDPLALMNPPAEALRKNDSRGLTSLVRARWPEFSSGGIIIKRYIRRNVPFLIKYLVRESRARHCFHMSYRLAALHIETATPLAAGERRAFGWLIDSYFLSWEVPNAVTLVEFRKTATPHQVRHALRQVARILAILHDHRFTHSDLSQTNFLVQAGNFSQPKVIVIDLDAIRCYPLYQLFFPVGFVLKQFRLMMRRVPVSRRQLTWMVAEYCKTRSMPLDSRSVLKELI